MEPTTYSELQERYVEVCKTSFSPARVIPTTIFKEASDLRSLLLGEGGGNFVCTLVRRGDRQLYDAVIAASNEVLCKEIVTAADEHGWRPLHWAAFTGQRELYQDLKQRGAEKQPTDEVGRYPSVSVRYIKRLGRWHAEPRAPIVHWYDLHRAKRSGMVDEMACELGVKTFKYRIDVSVGADEYVQETYRSILAVDCPPVAERCSSKLAECMIRVLSLTEQRRSFRPQDAAGVLLFGKSTVSDQLGVFAGEKLPPGKLLCQYSGTLTWNFNPDHEGGIAI